MLSRRLDLFINFQQANCTLRYRDVQLPVDVDSPIMNTTVRRNASVMTRNFCVSRQGEAVLDQESSWNFNQVTNQTEVGGIGQLNPRHCERNNTGQRSTTVILFLYTKYEKKLLYRILDGAFLNDFQFILSYFPCLKAPAWGSNRSKLT